MKKNPLISIFLVVFIDLVGFGIVIPILPYYAKSFGAQATTLGWLMMCYSGMQFLFSPFWGSLSDRIGRRPVILTCLVGISASMALLGFAKSLVWLFAARLLAGFFGANISTAAAYIADITKPEDRAKGMGMIGAAFGLGFLFGPALGGILSRWGYGAAGYAAGVLALLNFLFALKVLKEPPLSTEIRAVHRSHLSWTAWRKTVTTPQTGLAVLLFFVVTMGIAQLETSFALFLLARFHLDAVHAGLILALMALALVGIQGGAIGRLVRWMGEARLVLAGCGIMAVTLFSAALSHAIAPFIIFLLLQSVGYAITNPSLSSLVSRHAPREVQGSTMGIYQSAGSLARVFGPVAAGVLFDHIGITAPFVAAGILFTAALVLVALGKQVWNGKEPAVAYSQVA
ncbi:MAG: MFS transporter [Deltaproteobacteria bacterium]|nr:MFS transporter [Deltaproteobacteria bacterium]